ncbi:MAG TPA: hypothetical protein VFC46_13515 [Humisphaera sp.]|nr:hypothetical protein [Humisphaera sp.]
MNLLRVEVDDPSKYSPRDVKALREKLKASQSLSVQQAHLS